MNGDSSQPHLTPDDLEAWLAGAATPDHRRHVEQCGACLELVQAEEALNTQLDALPVYAPRLDFADQVFTDLADLEPRDMIDIQSFLWVQGSDEY